METGKATTIGPPNPLPEAGRVVDVEAIVTQESKSNMDATLIDKEKTSRVTRILIVDDEPVVVQGLKQIHDATERTLIEHITRSGAAMRRSSQLWRTGIKDA